MLGTPSRAKEELQNFTMSIWRIIHKEGPAPPGGWYFTDPRTGLVFNGMNFDYTGLMYAISQHRKANPRVYSPNEPQYLDVDYISAEYDAWLCKSLGHNPAFCKDMSPQGSLEHTNAAQESGSACPKCGETQASPKYCPTCAGQRLIGWICSKCGFYRNK